jgi:ketosteroid isomerase-like protein
MSQENIDVVRRVYAAAVRGDNEAAFELYAPDIEWDVTPSPAAQLGLEPVYHGHEGVRRFWRDYLSAFERLDFELEELIDAGDRVLAVVHERALGRHSGIAFDNPVFAVWTLRDGEIARMRVYLDRDEALEAAGLRE